MLCSSSSSSAANARRHLTNVNFGLDDDDKDGGEEADDEGGLRVQKATITAEQMFESICGQKEADGQLSLNDGE